jgi:LysR family hydrogen peroxide-inducible transcriptional activator
MNTRPHPFSLRQLQYLLAVAEHLSFRRAAEICHVSQPALSMQVAQVEDVLGIVLFDRDRRQVRLTPAGELFLPLARRLIDQAHTLTEDARRLRDPLGSLLRIGVIPTLAPYLLPRLSSALRRPHPELVVLWSEHRTTELVAQIYAHEVDAALLAAEADLGTLETAVIGVDVFSLALPIDHPLAGSPEPISLDALKTERILLLDEGHCLRTQALEACSHTGIQELAFRATSLSTLVHMVAAGAGVTLLPELAAEVERLRAPLFIRPIAAPAPRRTIVLGWRRESPLRAAMLILAESMRIAAGLPQLERAPHRVALR